MNSITGRTGIQMQVHSGKPSLLVKRTHRAHTCKSTTVILHMNFVYEIPSQHPKPNRQHVSQVVAPAVFNDKRALGEPLRVDFPILHQEVNDKPLVYLDNAATSQKPLHVLQALDNYYRSINSNVHRGVHTLSAKATTAFEDAREKVSRFINAQSHREVVFTRNASEAINLVAYTWGMQNLKEGDEVRPMSCTCEMWA